MPGFSLRNPHTIIVGALIVALLGLTAFARMPVDVFPNLKIPAVVVATFYPGMPPTEIERDITTRFERFFTLCALIQADAHAGPAASGGGSPPVVRIADISTLRLYLYVPEEETSLISRGMPATLRLREFPRREFVGTVARFATALDLSTRTMLTEVDLPNPKHELYPGMYADVTLELERHRNALKVPATSVGVEGDARFVYIVRAGQLAKLPVTTGISDAGSVEIASGLVGEEQVVTSISPALTEGGKVRAVVSGASESHGVG